MLGNAAFKEFEVMGKATQILSDNIKTLLTVRNMTRTELAERCGVAVSTATHWTNGRSHPNYSQLDKIAQALSVSVGDLFTENAHHANKKISLAEALAIVNDHLGYEAPKKSKDSK